MSSSYIRPKFLNQYIHNHSQTISSLYNQKNHHKRSNRGGAREAIIYWPPTFLGVGTELLHFLHS